MMVCVSLHDCPAVVRRRSGRSLSDFVAGLTCFHAVGPLHDVGYQAVGFFHVEYDVHLLGLVGSFLLECVWSHLQIHALAVGCYVAHYLIGYC